ncbi:S1 family peptidase [Kibdelosporangium phytohabitans]|uniref:S1 family peptidase n=1 Tax=Kibdelosporangium phytohabitans TaxID=860235 RepID=UPI0007C829BD|nr:S1 family peptidase [Kibdelosporangium phytohabitans]MBE1468494.1 streptogrisin C [Kibdelosporangium phytohabitans]
MGSHRVAEPRPFNRKILLGLVIGVTLSAGITVIATANQSPVAHETVEVGSSTPLDSAAREDVRLTPGEASTRGREEADLGKTVDALRRKVGSAYAGAWYDSAKRKLMVGIIDRLYIGDVRAAGAEPRMMKNNLAGLYGQKTRLDRLAASAPPTVSAWYVDPATNSVVIEARKEPAAEAFVDKAKGSGELVRIEWTDRGPRVLADVVGGRGYTIGDSRCSIGFAATGPAGTKHFVTAGHCTAAGGLVLSDGLELGRVNAGTFDTDGDFGLVDVTDPAAQATPSVDTRDGGPITVTGTEPAPIGASVCRSGVASGFRCGEITGIDETVNYGDGKIVRGLTRTSVCAEPGDSGGPFVSGTQAQGVTSGGIGDCASNGSTFFQPIVEAATKLGVSVVTG